MQHHFVGIDFETFYDTKNGYSLRKMDNPSYILDARFEATMCAVKFDNAPATWVDGPNLQGFFDTLDPAKTVMYGHNLMFDACIASWHFGFVPSLYICTLACARQLWQKDLRSISLDSLLKYHNLPNKGTFLSRVDGMRRADIINAGFWREYTNYAIGDIDGAHSLLKLALNEIPVPELQIADMVLRMATVPKFKLNKELLYKYYNEEAERKQALLDEAIRAAGLTDVGQLMSNDQFAVVLQALGVDPPTKTSLTTGKETWAFAKSDQGMKDLLEHEDDAVVAVVEARLAHKSTQNITRARRYLNIAHLNFPRYGEGMFPVPLKVSGAHTHRLSGDWKMNAQNPERNKPSLPPSEFFPQGRAASLSTLRRSWEAPPGHKVLACDSSQIEARMTASWCGQEDIVQQFRDKLDTYSIMATDIFGRPITKADIPERFVGKQCLAGDTLVLTLDGWKPIPYVTHTDKLWDGTEWVSSDGSISVGVKPCVTMHGVTATSDHEMLVGNSWVEWSAVCADPSLFRLALKSVTLPCWVTSTTKQDGTPFADANAAGRGALIGTTSPTVNQPNAVVALVEAKRQRLGGILKTLCQTTAIVGGYLLGSLQRSLVATLRAQLLTTTTALAGSQLPSNGAPTKLPSFGTSRSCQGGMIPSDRWTASTTTEDMSRATFGLPLEPRTCTTGVQSQSFKNTSTNLKPVFDIANAGPRRRFTILTDKGPILAHNCVLSAQYGVGPDKFRSNVIYVAREQAGLDMRGFLTPEFSEYVIKTYRTKTPQITARRRFLDECIRRMTYADCNFALGPVIFRHEHIVGPTGLKLYYSKLRMNEQGEWIFTYKGNWSKLYGGKLLENIIQFLARCVVMEAALRLKPILWEMGQSKIDLQLHDELVTIVPDEYVDVAREHVEAEMRRQVVWMPNCPVDCESGVGPNYAEAK